MKSKLASNVLEDISRRLQGGNVSYYNEGAIIVFNGSNIRLDKKLESIKIIKQRGIKISVAFSFMGDQLLDTKGIIDYLSPDEVYREEDIFQLQDIVNKNSILIGPNITINTLSKVALGMIDSFIPNLIWTFLYKGKKVYLDFTSVNQYLGEETKNKGILNILNGYIRTLVNMGIIEIDENNFNEVFQTQTSTIETSTKIENHKKVLTENDILSLSPSSNLILPRGTILTPLAKDKAREKNIIIEFK